MTPRDAGRKEVSPMAKPMYVRFEMPKDLVDKTYQSIELAKESGKVRKGTNEVTKLVERGEAQFVVMAEHVHRGRGDVTEPRRMGQGKHKAEEREGDNPGGQCVVAPGARRRGPKALGPVSGDPPAVPAPSAATRSSRGPARCSSERMGRSSCSVPTNANRTCSTSAACRVGRLGHRRSAAPRDGPRRRRRSSPRTCPRPPRPPPAR